MTRKALRTGVFAGLLAAAIVGAVPAGAGAVTVTLSADQTAVKAGTTVTYTAVISATPNADSGGINAISDSVIGIVDGQPTCITSSGPDFTFSVRSFTCVYTGVVAGRPGSTQSHILTAGGVETVCGAPPVTPGSGCPPAPPATYPAFAAASNEVGVLIKCKKGKKLRKGKCRPKK